MWDASFGASMRQRPVDEVEVAPGAKDLKKYTQEHNYNNIPVLQR